MTTHRRDVRPRYGRIGILAASMTISAVAALGGIGILATGSAQAGAGPKPASYTGAGGASRTSVTESSQTAPTQTRGSTPPGGPSTPTETSTAGSPPAGGHASATPPETHTAALPTDSGTGRRIVFSQSLQRVWLVASAADDVQRTYLVSGSVTDNLQPGTYSVYSRSRWAVGIDDSGVMQYFVRFTQGPTGAAIGFHSIPTKDGVLLQTRGQLGTPQSHGCIRQYLPDAVSLWNFAPVGTKVVVVA